MRRSRKVKILATLGPASSSEEMIRKLKKGAVIVNTARGKVIDEAAMIRALEDGHVSDTHPLIPTSTDKDLVV